MVLGAFQAEGDESNDVKECENTENSDDGDHEIDIADLNGIGY